jgi:hypothetical protein
VETKLVTFAGIDISRGKVDRAIFQDMILRPMALSIRADAAVHRHATGGVRRLT